MLARLLPCGEAALLIEVADATAVGAATAVLLDHVEAEGEPTGVVEVVPAARTVLVRYADPASMAAHRPILVALLTTSSPVLPPPSSERTIRVPVAYDGPDLAFVGELTGLSADEVVAAHTGRPWLVAFGGFAPGFAYLSDGDPRLRVPRRAEPRPAVPAGSVALAGEFSGIYPRASPGGWQLLGRTSVALWDSGRHPPALLRPGWWVRFEVAT